MIEVSYKERHDIRALNEDEFDLVQSIGEYNKVLCRPSSELIGVDINLYSSETKEEVLFDTVPGTFMSWIAVSKAGIKIIEE